MSSTAANGGLCRPTFRFARRATAAVVGLSALVVANLVAAQPTSAAPSNDNFADATPITAASGTVSATTVGVGIADGSGLGTMTNDDGSADVRLSMSDSPDPVMVGSYLKYKITVTNTGPSAATGIELTDVLPAGPTFVSAVSTQGSCADQSTAFTCDLDGLAAGGRATVTITVTPNRVGAYDNSATVTANEADSDPTNNQAVAHTTAVPNADGCTIVGSPSAETIVGTADADVICAGAGHDVVLGSGGDDTLRGDSGRDTLVGGSGNDTIDGGPGEDTVSYGDDPAGVIVSLVHHSASDGYGGTDTITDVSGVSGSRFADNITGAATDNRLFGRVGADVISALGGDDYLDGGIGKDTLDGGSGTDTCVSDYGMSRCERVPAVASIQPFGTRVASNFAWLSRLGRLS